MWAREWSTLSGGEGQRIALAIAIGLGGAEVVLLDGESCFTDCLGREALVIGYRCGGGYVRFWSGTASIWWHRLVTPESCDKMMANLSEPTSALDEETMKKVEKTLLSLLPSRVSSSRANMDLS
jgi:ABC-type iron transport system FetAB ATPase subunit